MKLFTKLLERKTKMLEKQLEDFHITTFVPEPFEMTTGSDYSQVILHSTLESLIRKNCGNCGGTGTRGVQNGPDDFNLELCEFCN